MHRLARPLIAAMSVASLVGCYDSSIAPMDATTRSTAPSDRPSLDYNGPSRFSGFRTATFTLTAKGGTFDIGGLYTLTVPANAVCVIGSSYGPGTWDQPCTTLANGESITITATYGFARGGPVVDFAPDLRFAPQKQVTLSTDLYAPVLIPFRSFFAADPSALRHFSIHYTPDLGATGFADASIDPSVITHVNLGTGVVWRRVKHFSGYNVVNGQSCEPSPNDPDCVEGPGPTVERQ